VALTVAAAGSGEAQAAAELRAAARASLPVTNGAGQDFIAFGDDNADAYGYGAEAHTPGPPAAAAIIAADPSRRKSAPAALQAPPGGGDPLPAPPRRTALHAEGTPPWWPHGGARALSRLRSPLLRLHTEIVDFCRFTEPTTAEAASRAAAVARVRAVVTSIWPGAKLAVFGSFATGLYLPTSDIDTVILDSRCASPGDGLRALALALARRGVGRKIALIAKARIPIVKFEEAVSGFAFDVSFDVANGPAAAEWMREQMAALPPLRPLSLVLKAFLQQRCVPLCSRMCLTSSAQNCVCVSVLMFACSALLIAVS
jgi:non-canonical poly(A) RNA polymerase PAPD5/7